MASAVDILLRIVGDSRDAVRAVRDVGTEAETTAKKVQDGQSRMAAFVDTIQQTALAIGGAIGAGQFIDQALSNLTSGRDQRDEANILGAGSRQDLVKSFNRTVDEKATKEGGSVLERLLGHPLPGFLRQNDAGVLAKAQQEAARQQFDELLKTSPGRAQVLAQEDPRFADIFAQELAKATQKAGFDATLPGATHVTVNTGVGDRNAIGREVRAALDARDRNNGRYQTTVTRRG